MMMAYVNGVMVMGTPEEILQYQKITEAKNEIELKSIGVRDGHGREVMESFSKRIRKRGVAI